MIKNLFMSFLTLNPLDENKYSTTPYDLTHLPTFFFCYSFDETSTANI
jgi:hypothetical protein